MLYDGVTLSPTLVPDGPQEFQNVECPSYDIARSSYGVTRSSYGIVHCRGYRLRWCPMTHVIVRQCTIIPRLLYMIIWCCAMSYDGRTMKFCDRTLSYDYRTLPWWNDDEVMSGVYIPRIKIPTMMHEDARWSYVITGWSCVVAG